MGDLTRFDPLNEMFSLGQAMDRLVEDSFVPPLSWRSVKGDSSPNPALDVHRTAERIVVSASLAGVKPEDVRSEPVTA
jgi:HSP20 family protein